MLPELLSSTLSVPQARGGQSDSPACGKKEGMVFPTEFNSPAGAPPVKTDAAGEEMTEGAEPEARQQYVVIVQDGRLFMAGSPGPMALIFFSRKIAILLELVDPGPDRLFSIVEGLSAAATFWPLRWSSRSRQA